MNRLIQVLAASGMLLAAPYHQPQERPEVPGKLESAGGRTGGFLRHTRPGCKFMFARREQNKSLAGC